MTQLRPCFLLLLSLLLLLLLLLLSSTPCHNLTSLLLLLPLLLLLYLPSPSRPSNTILYPCTRHENTPSTAILPALFKTSYLKKYGAVPFPPPAPPTTPPSPGSVVGVTLNPTL